MPMTIKELEEYRRLKNEVKQINESLDKLYDNKNALIFDTVKGSSHEAPFQERIFTITGLNQHYMKTYEKRKKSLEERLSRCLDKMSETEDFIKTIPKSEIRQIIELRYIRGWAWTKTARHVYGYPCPDRARMAITRYFAKNISPFVLFVFSVLIW